MPLTIINRATLPNETNAEIILAVIGGGDAKSFVTWVRNKLDGARFWGHYFNLTGYAKPGQDYKITEHAALQAALQDFSDRCSAAGAIAEC